MASIDLKDGYCSVPISSTNQKFLKFEWKGILYQVPNGLALFPRNLQNCLSRFLFFETTRSHFSAIYR